MSKARPGEGKAKSPYAKYNKRPWRYSELFHRWKKAVMEGRTDEARELSEQHRRAYG